MNDEHAMTHQQASLQLDEFVLGLLSEPERTNVENHIARCVDCELSVRSATAVRGVATRAIPAAPAGLRSKVLDSALRKRPAQPATSRPALEAWEAEAGRLLALAHELNGEHGQDLETVDDVWNRLCIDKFQLTVRDVLCHVIATFSLWASHLGSEITAEESGYHTIEDRTRAVVARHHHLAMSHTIDELEMACHEVGRLLRVQSSSDGASASHMVQGFSIDEYTSLLALEIWTHADDIRIAAGRQVITPEQVHLATMTKVLPQWVSTVLSQTSHPDPSTQYQLVLTGDAPGEHPITSGAGLAALRSQPDVTIICDAVDFCKLAGARRDANTFNYTAIGDQAAAASLVDALADFHVM